MNLKQLQLDIYLAIKHLPEYMKPEDVPVLINLSEPSIGAIASTKVKFAGMGFDWEHGQFRIDSETPIVRKGNALTDIKKVMQRDFGGRKYYACPHCHQKIAKDDYYCRYCGQKLKITLGG